MNFENLLICKTYATMDQYNLNHIIYLLNLTFFFRSYQPIEFLLLNTI